MHEEHDDDLTPDEAEMLAALPRQAAPPPELEDRVVAGLHARRLIRRGVGWRNAAALAAMLLISVALGYGVGARGAGSSPAPEAGPMFALLVYDPVDPQPGADTQVAVAEAQAWAGELAEIGIFRGAEKLSDGGRRLQLRGGVVERVGDVPGANDDLVLGGFFMIHADNFDDAQRIAAACPLLQYGSTIEIRAIEGI